jgi:hypothetical protein
MEARMGTVGRREFIQVLRLMENFHQHQVEQAVSEALRLSAISFDAVKTFEQLQSLRKLTCDAARKTFNLINATDRLAAKPNALSWPRE